MGERSATVGEEERETDLLDGTDEDGKTATDDEFGKTQKSGAVDVDKKVDDALHCGEGENEGETGCVEGGVDGGNNLAVGGGGEIAGHAGGSGCSALCGGAAGQQLGLCEGSGVEGGSEGNVETEGDEEEGEDGIGQPCEGEEMGQLEIGTEGSWVVPLGRRERHGRACDGRVRLLCIDGLLYSCPIVSEFGAGLPT